MKCPNCSKRAISFIAWGIGNRWARFQCPNCGADLKACRRTIKALLGCLLALPLYIWAGLKLCDIYHISDTAQQDLVFFAVALPSIALVGFWDWKTGSYALRQKPPEQPRDRE